MTGAPALEPAQRLAASLQPGTTHVVLQEQASLSWLLGARSNVPRTLDAACFDAVVVLGGDGEADAVEVVTNAVEAPRLQDVELVAARARLAAAGVALRWTVVPWWQGRGEVLPSGPGVLADRPGPGRTALGEDFRRLRRMLDTRQQAVLASVCADAQRVTGQVVRGLGPDLSEHEAAGRVMGALEGAGLDPVALFVAGADRMLAHRHPLPTHGRLGRRCLVACCARRDGAVASVTRIVSFEPVDEAGRRRYAALLEVERAFLDASTPGARLGTAFAVGAEAYSRHGFAAREWHRHHQGGPSGWAPRELLAHPGSEETIGVGSVLAWNPSGDGWKVEDTWLVDDDGLRALATDPAWPHVDVGGRARPSVLELAARPHPHRGADA